MDSSKSDPGGIPEESKEDDLSRGRQSMSGSKDKGNVVISVRVRPEPANNDGNTSAGEWLVDGRQSLIAYKGREGGDYYYGGLTHWFGARCCGAS